MSDAEALGVARRLARLTAQSGRAKGPLADPPDTMPPLTDLTLSAYRIPTATIYRVRARAEVEGRRVSDVVRELLEGYAGSAPGTTATFSLPTED